MTTALPAGDIEWTDEIKFKFCSVTPNIFGKCFLDYFNYEIFFSLVLFWGGMTIATTWYVYNNYDYVTSTANWDYGFITTSLKCTWIGVFSNACEKDLDKFERN